MVESAVTPLVFKGTESRILNDSERKRAKLRTGGGVDLKGDGLKKLKRKLVEQGSLSLR